MTSKYDGDAARLRLAVARVGRHLRAVDASAALTPTQMSLLSTVVRHGPLGLSLLSEAEGVDAPSLSRSVSRLEEQGLLRRLPDPADRRAVLVEATAAGKRLQARLRAARADALQAQLAALSSGERDRLHEALPVLEALADGLKQQRTHG
jgi:DNA-binding MarR family transcriptional regulator